ncbi:MAG: DUF2254 family protein [Blastocatellales bacterium]
MLVPWRIVCGKNATEMDQSDGRMNESDGRLEIWKERVSDALDSIRRAFAEFLTIPTSIIIGFLLLAIGTYLLDRSGIAWLKPAREILRENVFANAEATSALLGTIAGGIITVTSITISLLLLALQQSAASMTAVVFDQFLRRWHNQVYFGFFVGLALYSLVTLATVSEPFNPVFGATCAFLLTVIALYLLILLLYTTINQMRPVEIIETIHDLTLAARESQLAFVRKTRRSSSYDGVVSAPVKAPRHGFMTRLDLEIIGSAIADAPGEVEIILLVSIGSYVAYEDTIAEVKARTRDEAVAVGKAVRRAAHIERQRDVDTDPAYGIEQLEMIAWTSISTSKSNPAPGLLTILSLRDVLSRWVSEDEDEDRREPPAPVVYTDDVFARLMEAFETLAVVSSESMQHQNFTEVLRTFAVMFDRLPRPLQRRAEDLILRILSALGDHILTAELNAALSELTATLAAAERWETANAVQAAQDKLALSVGKLNSRSTRAG